MLGAEPGRQEEEKVLLEESAMLYPHQDSPPGSA